MYHNVKIALITTFLHFKTYVFRIYSTLCILGLLQEPYQVISEWNKIHLWIINGYNFTGNEVAGGKDQLLWPAGDAAPGEAVKPAWHTQVYLVPRFKCECVKSGSESAWSDAWCWSNWNFSCSFIQIKSDDGIRHSSFVWCKNMLCFIIQISNDRNW